MSTSSNGLLFYLSYFEAIQELNPTQRLEAYESIFRYAFLGIEPTPSKAFRPLWKLIKPNIDSSIKKRDDGSKGGRKSKTSGLNKDETTGSETTQTTGSTIHASNKEKDIDKEIDKRKRIGANAPERRNRKSPAEPVFESLPASFERIGYAATEDLKKQTIAQLDKAAQHTTAKPPEDDPETRQLKQQFLQKTAAHAAPSPNTPADTSNETRTEASTQTPAAALSDRPTQTDPEGK